jgi:hypothetical protein
MYIFVCKLTVALREYTSLIQLGQKYVQNRKD